MGNGYMYTNPIVKDNTIIVCGADNTIYSIDIESGGKNWEFQTGGDYFTSTPMIYNDIVYIGGLDNYLYALDFKTGIELWKYDVGEPIYNDIIIENNIAVVNFGDKLIAIDTSTRMQIWENISDEPDSGYSSDNETCAIHNNTIFVNGGSYLYAFDLNSGQEKWKYKREATGDCSSPMIVNDMVIYGDEHYIFALDENTGIFKWKVNFGLNAFYYGTPSVSNNILTIGAFSQNKDSHVICAVDLNNLKEVWETKSKGSADSSFSIADNIVFEGSMDGYLYAFDLFTGLQKWGYKTGSYDLTSPAIANGMVFVSSDDGYIYAFE
jgi:outer membrane protein assembly factor BamB